MSNEMRQDMPTPAPRRGRKERLTEETVRDWAGCTEAGRQAKLSDGGGLFLIQRVPGGQKVWRVRVPSRKLQVVKKSGESEADIEEILEDAGEAEATLGSSPEMSLDEARQFAAVARQLAYEGVDVTSHKALLLAHKRLDNSATFGSVCERWWEANHEAKSWSEKTAREKKSIYGRWLKTRSIWNARLNDIILPLAVGALDACTRQSVTTGRKLRQILQDVGRYAMAIGAVKSSDLATVTETPSLKAYRKAAKSGHRHLPAVTDLARAGLILRDNNNVNCSDWQITRATLLLALTAQRPGNVAAMRWDNLNPELTVWSIPREVGVLKVIDKGGGKGDQNFRSHHIVPLQRQATELLKGLDRHSEWVFHSPIDSTAHITEDALVRHHSFRLGLKGLHTPHGWRSTFSTWANDQTTPDGERKFGRDEIELILDHKVGTEVHRVYNRGVAIKRLSPILQAWADALYDAWVKARRLS